VTWYAIDGTPDGQAYTPIIGAEHALVSWYFGPLPPGPFDQTFNATPPDLPDLSKYSFMVILWRVLTGYGSFTFTGVGVSGNCQIHFNGVPVINLSGMWSITGNRGHDHLSFFIDNTWQFISLSGILNTIRVLGSWSAEPADVSDGTLDFTCWLLRSKP
jgi:hypothetical protein